MRNCTGMAYLLKRGKAKKDQSKGVETMTEQLKQAFEAAQRLPDEAQRNMILERIEAAQQLSNAVQSEELERILDKIDELEWDAIVSKPYVKQRLLELGRKAMEEDRAGETEEGGFVGERVLLNNSTREPLTEEKRAERAERIMELIMSKPQKGTKFLQMAGIVEERISPEKD
jgi:hypothetical protein